MSGPADPRRGTTVELRESRAFRASSSIGTSAPGFTSGAGDAFVAGGAPRRFGAGGFPSPARAATAASTVPGEVASCDVPSGRIARVRIAGSFTAVGTAVLAGIPKT